MSKQDQESAFGETLEREVRQAKTRLILSIFGVIGEVIKIVVIVLVGVWLWRRLK